MSEEWVRPAGRLLRCFARQQTPRLQIRIDAEGFTILEVLVSLVIAALLMTACLRVFGSERLAISANDDLVAASTLARGILAEARRAHVADGLVRDGTKDGFRWRITARSLALPDPATGTAPPPQAPPASLSESGSQQANQSPNAGPATQGVTDGDAVLALFQVAVDVFAPSGRHARLEGLVAQAAAEPADEK
jgi:prepilin-type N-terminal cleavage/methylation domain-containing protein